GRTEEVVESLVRDIDEAQEHVHLLFYIIADDETGRKVAEALMRAAKRGVKCRVLADAVGSRGMFGGLGERMRQVGVEVREALPVGLFRRRMARIDLRNHRKVAVIDGRIGYAGSQNIVDASYGRKDMLWHDLMVRLRGPVVLELQAVFVGDWYFEAEQVLEDDEVFPEPEVAGKVSAQTLPSGPNYPTENYQRMVVAALYAAAERVVITTPYFVPDESFMQAMETAVLRGVEVELILPRKSDMVLVNAASRAYFDDLLEAGVRIFLYDDGLLHAKTMSIDDKIAFIGSGNFDIRSFELNFEVNLLFYGSEVTGQLKALQQEYLSRSVKVTQHRWSTRPMMQKVVQNVAKLLSPLL
ncbi:MAG: cardiolipin synthase, partial [Sedimentisphaerales bacterium]|nr:cardiolipin synthase [Sedimentisphaerales bacterium]